MKGRTLLVRLKRNQAKDGVGTERIRYSGYDIFWPDGEAIRLGFERFCQLGVRTLLGRHPSSDCCVAVCLTPTEGLEAPLPVREKGIRFRRIFLVRLDDHRAAMYLHDGTPTDIVFDTRFDDTRVTRWIGFDEMQQDTPYWYDVMAKTVDTEGCGP